MRITCAIRLANNKGEAVTDNLFDLFHYATPSSHINMYRLAISGVSRTLSFGQKSSTSIRLILLRSLLLLFVVRKYIMLTAREAEQRYRTF